MRLQDYLSLSILFNDQEARIPRFNQILIILIGVLTIACSKEKQSDHRAPHAFYFWQTTVETINPRDSIYKSLDVQRIYCRFFDVAWNKETSTPIPVAPLRTNFNPWDSTDLVPVVFITNETFKNMDATQVPLLAKNVHARIMRHLSMLLINPYGSPDESDNWWWEQNPYQAKSLRFGEQTKHDSIANHAFHSIHEIQFDCDWTETTKEKYFAFLTESQKLFKDYLISSTIRLYQYRYPEQAGVPPVKRGMLMCYNAGDVTDAKTKNSIFDQQQIMEYLDDAPAYPIALDYALPIFGWALVYHDNTLKCILPAHEMLSDYKVNLVEEETGVFKAKQDFTFGFTNSSQLIREGDVIHVETPDLKAVGKTAAWLGDHKNNAEATISLYHLNNYDIQNHPKEIQAIFDSF